MECVGNLDVYRKTLSSFQKRNIRPSPDNICSHINFKFVTQRESSMTPTEGRLYQKEFHGRNEQGDYSDHSFVTACCNLKNDLNEL